MHQKNPFLIVYNYKHMEKDTHSMFQSLRHSGETKAGLKNQVREIGERGG